MANKWEAVVTPSQGFRKVGQDLDKISKEILNTRDLIKFAGPVAVKAIAGRTAKGSDVRDRPMRQYNQFYAEKKKGGRLSPRTLTDTGTMMDAMSFRVINATNGEVYFKTRGNPNREALARIHHDDVNFFGMSPSDKRVLNQATIREMERVIRGSNLSVLEVTGSSVLEGSEPWTDGKADV